MTARYPGDTQDALFMEDGSPHWWMSPDLGLNGFGLSVANPGNNTVNLRVHLRPNTTFAASQADIEVFVGNPSITMTPATTVRIGSVQVVKSGFPTGGGSQVTSLPWTVTADPQNPGGGDQPGHRCLIARVYPFGSGKPGDFQVPTDDHEAQRNICITPCAEEGPMVAGAGAGMAGTPEGEAIGRAEDGLWVFLADTSTPSKERPERVTLRATWAPELPTVVLEEASPVLERLGFQGFAERPPRKFFIDVERGTTLRDVRDVPRAQLVDQALARLPGVVQRLLAHVPGFDRRRPFHEVDVELEPRRISRCGFRVDLSTTSRGEAQVFHLEQIGSNRERQGGLTLVFVRVV